MPKAKWYLISLPSMDIIIILYSRVFVDKENRFLFDEEGGGKIKIGEMSLESWQDRNFKPPNLALFTFQANFKKDYVANISRIELIKYYKGFFKIS